MANANTSGAINRIMKEIAQIQRGEDLSLAVAFRDQDVRHVRALIIGPPETPYEFGMFEFDIKFGKEYPIKSPNVRAVTTNSSRTRFNPNIYNEGKVCLSILGTWRGNPGEEWSSAQGLESVLLSIQSLMSQNPYENEPGHEHFRIHEAQPKAYVAKITHETIRIAVCKRLEGLLGIKKDRGQPVIKKPRMDGSFSLAIETDSTSKDGEDWSEASTPATTPSVHAYDAEATYKAVDPTHWDPFADLLKRRFLWYYDTYMQTVERESKLHKQNEAFKRMQFEYRPNSMEGKFDYKSLHARLTRIRETLEEEQRSWAKAGAKQVADGTQLAVQLAFQFGQLEHKWNNSTYDSSRMEISLLDKENPFVWRLTLFGKPMTNLDGGIFNMTLHIPPNFPEMQPRLKIETPIFHHRVSTNGALCYFPEKEEEIASHLEAIVRAIEDEDPKYDPRSMMNPEAFALRWGGDDKKKLYSRNLRRSAQESCEY
ncbi:putative ubiquitin-conjugating enzyme family protein [Teratosphaeria destructans]|uniref:Ubiquitin-conjugating enzyme family protein n=1 Tax=Teratosphaeria destructans TaxID=418781 RepID=A0A9W7SQE0_9PEZI|nr:putative ubiquitin-conjugating enzyme family protein [Teratosphaeria destructans]